MEVSIGGNVYNRIIEIGWMLQQRFRDETLRHYRTKFPIKKKKGVRFQETIDYEKYNKWISEHWDTMEFRLLCLDILFEPINGAPPISEVLRKTLVPPEEDAIIWKAINDFFVNVQGKQKPSPTSEKGSPRTKGSQKKA